MLLQGLRTLALGSKVLEEEEWAAWDARYQEAAADLDDRDARLAALYAEAEANLELVGVTAIEDKLQAGVPEAIHTLLQAGIKVIDLYHTSIQENIDEPNPAHMPRSMYEIFLSNYYWLIAACSCQLGSSHIAIHYTIQDLPHLPSEEEEAEVCTIQHFLLF